MILRDKMRSWGTCTICRRNYRIPKQPPDTPCFAPIHITCVQDILLCNRCRLVNLLPLRIRCAYIQDSSFSNYHTRQQGESRVQCGVTGMLHHKPRRKARSIVAALAVPQNPSPDRHAVEPGWTKETSSASLTLNNSGEIREGS
ncbi:unnamed protein product [Ectocarpus sp. 4 AP-2014]